MNIRTSRIMVLLGVAAIVAMISMGCAKKAPQDAGKLIQDGLQSYKQGDYQKAMDMFTQAVDADPKNAEAHFFKGNCLALLGKKQEAIAEYDKSIQLAPNVPQPYYNEGNAYASLGKDKEALEAFDKAIEREPTYGKAYYNKAMVLSRMGRTREAQEALAKARSAGGQLPGQPGQPAQPPQGAAPGK
ncbi:MAG: tetratricopeptide repeat protein [Nitrospirota bacterium]